MDTPLLDPRLRGLLIESAVSLFDERGLPLREVDALPREQEIAGVIGFTGHLRGTLIVASKRDLLEESCPLPSTDVSDWTAELANQLLGRFKNRLIRYGLEVAMATPVAVRGLHLSYSTPQRTSTYVVFSAPSGTVVVGLEAIADAPLVWCDETNASLDEGSLELF
ncbi:MAG TPA: chemotaxis protein CheX [Myxococcota bacterium]|jgi:CheY-specific phosphatase CheX